MRLIAELANQLLELLRGQLGKVGIVAMRPRAIDQHVQAQVDNCRHIRVCEHIQKMLRSIERHGKPTI
jgi:hypothetical protein